jgi:carbonic anhydrase/acetyltransferase-like protein (isoleucine patch superfamily)
MNLEANPARDYPQVEATAYVHPTAVVIGNVPIGPGVSVGPHAVLRADEPDPNGTVAPIIIGSEANIQDGVVLHALGGTGVDIGPGTSVAHGAFIHGPCETGSGCIIGFNSVV